MTITDQIQEYLEAQLAKIRKGQKIKIFTGEEYTCRTDAGQLVDVNQEYTEHPDDMPSLVLYLGKKTSTFEGDPEPELGMENHILPVSIEGFIECDKAGTEAKDLRTDLTVVLKADLYWNGLIVKMENFETDYSIQVGDQVFAIVKASCIAIYTAPYGSE